MSEVSERMGITDEVGVKLGKGIMSSARVRGEVIAILRGPDGLVKQIEWGSNLVTDHGDEHIGERIALDGQDIVTGMRLGNDSATAASKAGAGSNIVTYISGSQEALDAVAVGSDLGSGVGWRQAHVCTWIAGDVTDADIEEAVLTDETPITDVAGASGNVVARFIFGTTIDKQAGDSLEVTWNLDALGA